MKYLITYLGDHDGHGPNVLAVRGVEFKKNVETGLEVSTPDGEALLAKLKGNRHFRVEDAIDEQAKPAKPAKADKAAKTDA